MSAIDNAIAQLEHDLELAKLGRIVNADHIERRLAELRKERTETFDEWLRSIPRPTWTKPDLETQQAGWELTPMGMDETFYEAEQRTNQQNHRK